MFKKKVNAPIAASLIVAVLAVSQGASGSESAADAKILLVENGLLPSVSLKENLGATASITDRMSALGIPGASIAVIDDGKVVWTRAYGLADTVEKTPVTTETLFQAGSISKPIAALGALRLVKEGVLSLDDDVNTKLETWRIPVNDFTRDEKVTLRRLLSHTAGLTVHGFPGYAVGTPIPNVVQVLNGEAPANTAPVRVDLRPGSQYRYSGGGYTVMQLLVADVSRQAFEDFMQAEVLHVLGMDSSTYSQVLPADLSSRRASGHRPGGTRVPGKVHIYPEMAAAGLWTTPTDLARCLLYVQAAVRGEMGELLDPALTEQLLTRQEGSPHGLGPVIHGEGATGRFGHNGVDEGFEAQAVAYIEQGKGVVIMANSNGAGAFFEEVKGSVARAYDWPEFPVRSQLSAERISKTLLERAPGKYRLRPDMTGDLTAKDGRLFLETERGVIEVFAKSEMELFSPLFGERTFLVVEKDGKVTSLRREDGIEFTRID